MEGISTNNKTTVQETNENIKSMLVLPETQFITRQEQRDIVVLLDFDLPASKPDSMCYALPNASKKF